MFTRRPSTIRARWWFPPPWRWQRILTLSGLGLLEAVVVGYEAMARAGLAVGPVSHMLAGFHPTSMSGVFGAAAAAGHLRRLDAAGLNHAFGIAASLASGTMEFASLGGNGQADPRGAAR